MVEAKFLKDDYLRHFDGRGFRFQEIDEKPSAYWRRMYGSRGRREMDKHEFHGFHIDNDDLKDMAQDVRHFVEDVEDFMDPKNPTMAKGIKLDAQLRFSPNVQKLIKMVMKDFNIKNEHDLERAFEKIVRHVGKDIASCPYFRRSEMAAERMLRFAMKSLKISDLPWSRRERWVNDVAKKLYRTIVSQNRVHDLEKLVGRAVHDVFHELEDYMEDVEREEQKYNKHGGI